MILEESYLQWLLDESLKVNGVPRGRYGVAIEGSIAEGFGNTSSDIDFIVIEAGDIDHKTMPTLLFIDDRRIEVRVRSHAQVREQAAELRRLAAARRGRAPEVPEDLLDRCQRIHGAVPLRGHDFMREAQNEISTDELIGVTHAWFATRAEQAGRCAAILLALGQDAEAASWGRVTANQSAKAWAAARGETYLSPKWVSQQLARISGGQPVLERFRSLDSPCDAAFEPRKYVSRCLAFAGDLGLRVSGDPGAVRVAVGPGVTTWRIGQRMHVVRDKRDIFTLGARAERVWQRLTVGVRLAELLDRLSDVSSRTLLARFHRLGLINFHWPAAGRVNARPISGGVPVARTPVLSIEGALPGWVANADDIHLLPIPASKFASAGMALMWSNMMIENAREDALGAIAGKQWSTFENSGRRMVREACRSVLSAYGVEPLPHTEEACSQLLELEGVPLSDKEEVQRLHFDLRVESVGQAQRTLEVLDELVRRFREITHGRAFPSSFVSAEEWRRTLELGYDWARIGAYMDSTFPYDEVREILTSTVKRRPASTPSHEDASSPAINIDDVHPEHSTSDAVVTSI